MTRLEVIIWQSYNRGLCSKEEAVAIASAVRAAYRRKGEIPEMAFEVKGQLNELMSEVEQ